MREARLRQVTVVGCRFDAQDWWLGQATLTTNLATTGLDKRGALADVAHLARPGQPRCRTTCSDMACK